MKPVRTMLAMALAAAAASVALPASAQTYSKTVFFGDSLTDSGFYRPFLAQQNPQAAILGKFTTNPGLVWSEYLADFYGTSAAPAWGLTTTGIAAGSGTNYAAGGATVRVGAGFPPTPPTQFAPSLTTQINTYLATNGGRADPDALFTVWGGANDLFFHLNGAITQAQFIGAAGQQVGLVATLQGAGARYVMVPTMPDVGSTPFGLSQGAAGSAGITALVNGYNQALFGGLAQQNLRVIPLDTYTLLHEITASPAAFGISNVTLPACGATSSLICSPANLIAPNADSTFAFADGVHPSSKGHAILGDYAISILEAPRQLAVLTHSASTVGRSRADRVSTQIEQRPEAEGSRWWADGRLDTQRYGNGDDYDGMGPTVSFGMDWASGALVFGGFVGYGVQDIDWGNSRGDFEQTDATLGGYLGWSSDAFWATAQASYTWLSYDIDRDVKLGPVTRTHTGSPDGENLGLAASAGWDFEAGTLKHGPVVSVVSQMIDIDGYDENSTESTALTFLDQEYDSLIGSVGWQLRAELGNLQPYARLTYDHEFEDEEEEVFAQLRSMPGLAPYAVPGIEFDQDYGTLTFGARTQVFGMGADIGTSLTVGQKGGNDATLFVSLNGTF